MDRDWAKPWESKCQVGHVPAGFTLPSRAAALNTLLPALRSQLGLVVVTGEAGVGKSWLGERLRAEVPAHWNGAAIDPSPANSAVEFYRLVGHALGLSTADDLGSLRLALADFLKESSAEGRAWVLTIDEAHGLTLEVLEEIRLLSNRLGRPDGFAGLILLGQTSLARRLASRALASLAARIAARAHLRALDIEETESLVAQVAPTLAARSETLEFLHREVGGNPKRLLNAARLPRLTTPPTRPSAPPFEAPPGRTTLPLEEPESASAPAAATEPPTVPHWESPVLGEGKPPLRIEEGLIEVGWEPDSELADPALDASLDSDSDSDPALDSAEASLAPQDDEAIQDRYAALQAWNEWARNQGRTPTGALDAPVEPRTDGSNTLGDEVREDFTESSPIPPGVWADGQQSFAPYSQLFSRLKPRREPT